MKLLDVEVDGWGAVVLTERIGGTSTCWIPFLACNCALILAAAAAVCTPVSPSVPRYTQKKKMVSAHLLLPWDPVRQKTSQKYQRQDCEAPDSTGCADESNQNDEKLEIANGGQISIDVAQVRFGQSEIALRDARRRP